MPSTLTIGLRLWMWAAVLRVLKHVVPIATLVRLARHEPSAAAQGRALKPRLQAFLDMNGRFPFRPPGNCLERSLGVYRLLCNAGAEPELVVGVRRSRQGVEGHVWVNAEGRTWAERADDLSTFTTIVTFDAKGGQRTAAGLDGTLSTLRVP